MEDHDGPRESSPSEQDKSEIGTSVHRPELPVETE